MLDYLIPYVCNFFPRIFYNYLDRFSNNKSTNGTNVTCLLLSGETGRWQRGEWTRVLACTALVLMSPSPWADKGKHMSWWTWHVGHACGQVGLRAFDRTGTLYWPPALHDFLELSYRCHHVAEHVWITTAAIDTRPILGKREGTGWSEFIGQCNHPDSTTCILTFEGAVLVTSNGLYLVQTRIYVL